MNPSFSTFRNAIKRRIRRSRARLDWRLIKIASRSGFLSSFYYAFLNSTFHREHQAVLQGRVKFENSKRNQATTTSLLRRNIHRLEKGLIGRPRRDIFALDYINETIEFYLDQLTQDKDTRLSSSVELQWAYDVLKEYFKITGDHPLIQSLEEKFSQFPITNSNSIIPKRPYKRDLNSSKLVEYDHLLNLAWQRRSVRWFLPKPIPRKLIEKAIDIASLSPSACNRQPFIFRVFDDPKLVNRIASLPKGTKGFFYQFPVVIALIGELRNYYDERDKHLIYIDASLAAMSFILAAETLALSTCCINWPDIEEDEKRAEEVLKLKKDQRPIMFIALGYPDPEGMVAYSQKKPVDQICKYNFE